MKRLLTILLIIVFAVSVLLIGSGCSQQTVETTAAETTAAETIAVTEEVDFAALGIDLSKYAAEISNGPNGETPVRASDISLTDEEIVKIKEGKYKAARLIEGSGLWSESVTAGAISAFNELGIEIVATANAEFDPVKQAADVENVTAMGVDIIIGLPVDAVSAKEYFQPAVDAGISIVLIDNGINDYTAGDQYAAITTGDHFGMGRGAADLMAEAIGGKGKIGWIYHDADFFITNNRDRAFAAHIKNNYPDIQIVAAGGFSEEAKAEEVASAMILQNPDIDGIYVSWAVAAEYVVSALRAAGRDDVKVVTCDLDPITDLDMASGGNVYGVVSDLVFDLGATAARVASANILGKEIPPFIVVDLIKIKKDNLIEGYQAAVNSDPSKEILEALGQ